MSDIDSQRFSFDEDEVNEVDELNETFDDDMQLVDEGFSSFAQDDATASIDSDSSSHTAVSQFANYRESQENNSWDFRSRMAKLEGEKEYELFRFWLTLGSGRSHKFLSITYNQPESHILKIANRNNWAKRAADYDRHQLQLRLQLEQDERAKLHKQKLEEYRLQQEFIGRSLSANAAKLSALVANSLDKMMNQERELDIRDIPAVLNAANKAAEVARNLQSSALGVDQLLTALEEYED
jgi:hypothetical protein